jgi:hypothetical protein
MEKIKLPRCSYDELIKIIVSYGTLNRPSSLNDIAQASGIGKTNVSANNAFLTNLEIIEGAGKKNITSKGLQLSQALQHDMDDAIRSSWSQIINENDFMTKMLQAVRIRKGMDNLQLENHIAFSSGEPKASFVKTGAKCVVDILLASELVQKDGDKIIYNSNSNVTENLSSVTTVIAETKPGERDIVEVSKSDSPIIRTQKSGININIELNITAKPDELEGLGAKIKSIIDELNEE